MSHTNDSILQTLAVFQWETKKSLENQKKVDSSKKTFLEKNPPSVRIRSYSGSTIVEYVKKLVHF